MANILIHPNSGIIEFSTGTAGGGLFNPNFTGGAFASRLNYDNFGGLNFRSYVSNPTGLDRFSVDGANGRLFSVTDSLSGSLFSVNDIAGLPIIEAFDDNTVIMGAFNRNDFIITGNSVGIGAPPNTGTQKLFVSGNFAVSGSSVFSVRPNVNSTGVVLSGEAATPQNLATTGSTLDTKINSLSGYSNNTFATITNLAATGSSLQTQINNLDLNYATDASVSGLATNLATTGSTLNTKINSLSGNLTSTYATIANLATTGSNLQTSINTVATNLTLTGAANLARINSLSGYSDGKFATVTNLATTGSTLNTKINSLSGNLTSTYATIANLATTGSTLNTRINSLSGYINSPFSNIVFTTGNQTIGGYKFITGAANLSLLQVGGYSFVTPAQFLGDARFQALNAFLGASSSSTLDHVIGFSTAPSQFNVSQVLMMPGSSFLNRHGAVFVTGNQTVSGIKNFISRPTVNNTGVVLSGEAATPQNLFTTGSTLNTRINSLSGYINSPSSKIVFTTGNQTISGQKIFKDKLLVGLTTPDAETPDNILQTNSLTIAGVDLTAGGQVPSTIIKGGVFLGKSDGSLGILTNSNSIWGPTAFEFAGVNFDVTAYNNIYFSAGYLPQFWLDTNGNVGIDTAYPSERLEVNGNVKANNLVYNTSDQTINGLKSFVNSDPSTNVIVSFDGDYGNPLEIVTTDEGLSAGYGSSAYAIGVGAAGFAVKYTSSASDWGQPILVAEGGATVVRPASTITFPQPLLAPNLVYSSGDYNYFTTSTTLGNSYINLANSTSGITATLPSITSGRNYIVKNLNTGTLTVTGSNSIDGNVNLKLYKNESAHLLGVRNIGFTGWVSLNTNPGIS